MQKQQIIINNPLFGEFPILKDISVLETIKCKGDNHGNFVCLKNDCEFYPFMCYDKKCICKKDHQKCLKILTLDFIQKITNHVKRSDIQKFIEEKNRKIDQLIQKRINEVMKLKNFYKNVLKNKIKAGLFTQKQREILLNIQNNKVTHLKGKNILKIFEQGQKNKNKQNSQSLNMQIQTLNNQWHRFQQKLNYQIDSIKSKWSLQIKQQNYIQEKLSSHQILQKDQKDNIKSENKWTDFRLHEDIIAALKDQGKGKPTGVQAQTLQITTNLDRKRFNYLIRAGNRAGKTMVYLLSMINALQPGIKIVEGKTFKGKVIKNQIFVPQGIIILQNNILQQQIESILQLFIDYGKVNKSEKLNFTIGKLDKDGHVFADIIICQAKSFLNRHSRGNMKLDNCKFVAIDQVNDIYQYDRDSLAKVLEIIKQQKQNPHLITCSTTINKQFLKFYEQNGGQYITNKQRKDEQKIVLPNVNNYYMQIQGKAQMHKYIIKTIFKHLYQSCDKNKPQVFVFFNSIDQINQFNQYFQSIATDFTNPESEYLGDVSRGIISIKKYEDNKKVDMTIEEKRNIITKFKNNQTNILLCTNIIPRGLDIRNPVFVINVGVPKKSQKDDSVDIDTYIHRAGLVGRYKDRGVALTITQKESQTKILITNFKKIHNIDIKKLSSPANLVKEIYQCIINNAKN